MALAITLPSIEMWHEFEFGVGASLTAAVLSAIGGLGIRRFLYRRGHLAGWWWQVTYPPVETAAVSPPDGPSGPPEVEVAGATAQTSWQELGEPVFPWSIELLRVRHAKNQGKGKMWRVSRTRTATSEGAAQTAPTYKRRWRSEFRGENDGGLDGHYWCTRGSGGHGTYQLKMLDSCRQYGEFRAFEHSGASDVTSKLVGAPMEWIKYGSEGQAAVRHWLVVAPELELVAASKHWPFAVRHRVRKITGYKIPLFRVPTWLIPDDISAVTAVTGDLTIALAAENAKRHRSQSNIESDDSVSE